MSAKVSRKDWCLTARIEAPLGTRWRLRNSTRVPQIAVSSQTETFAQSRT